MTWIPTSKQLPPDGEVVETKDEDYDFNKVYLLYYEIDKWIGGRPPNYTPTHWRKKKKK